MTVSVKQNQYIVTFSSDTVLLIPLTKKLQFEHYTAVENFVAWCDANKLQINISKTGNAGAPWGQ